MSLTFGGRGSYLPFYNYVLGGGPPQCAMFWKSGGFEKNMKYRKKPLHSL